MFRYLLIFLTLSSLLAFSQEDTQPIVVRLATNNSLIPVYVAPIEADDAQSYDLQHLHTLLVFDLNHNGSTSVIPNTSMLDQILHNASNSIGRLQDWQAQHVAYVIKTKIVNRHLTTLIFSVNGQAMQTIEQIPLNEQRHSIHQLADAIHLGLFGQDGIASTRILYTIRNPKPGKKNQWSSEIWEADYDGANAHPITTSNHYCLTPVYIPPKPGYKTGGIIYVSYEIGQPKLYVASLNDGKGRRLLSLRNNQLMPAISRNRDKIAFISDITGNPDLFLQSFDPETGVKGKPQQIFSAKQATQGSPTFSPDGKSIAFVSDKDGSPRIYTIFIPTPGISLNAIKATLISKKNRENSAPVWSPDGTKIAYCARNQGDRQIWIYDFNTQQERQITQGSGNKENPSWAPNSLHLVFNAGDADSAQLYFINLNQSEATQITQGSGEKRFPCWEPRT